MNRFTVILGMFAAFLLGCVGSWTLPVILADWNASKQLTLVEREINLAYQMDDTRKQCADLVEWWNGESISTQPDFEPDPRGISEAEQTDLITDCMSLKLFWENGVVTQSNRQLHLQPFKVRVNP